MKIKDVKNALVALKPFVDRRASDEMRCVLLEHQAGYGGRNTVYTTTAGSGAWLEIPIHTSLPPFDAVAVPHEYLTNTIAALIDAGYETVSLEATGSLANPWAKQIKEVLAGDWDTEKCLQWLREHDAATDEITTAHDSALTVAREALREALEASEAPVWELELGKTASLERCRNSIATHGGPEWPATLASHVEDMHNRVVDIMEGADKIYYPPNELKIRAGDTKVALAAYPVDGFLANPTHDKQPRLILTRLDVSFIDVVKARMLPHAATDDSRPVLTGVSCVFAPDQLTLAATDGFQLGLLEIPYPNGVGPQSQYAMVIPGNVLKRIKTKGAGRIGTDTFDVVYFPKSNAVSFAFGDAAILTIPCIDAVFPDYRPIIPVSPVGRIEVATADVKVGLKVTRPLAQLDMVELEPYPGPGRMTIEAAGNGESGTAEHQIDATFTATYPDFGWPPVAVSGRKLQTVLDAVAYPDAKTNVTMSYSGNRGPVVVEKPGDDGYMALLMPMSKSR